MSHDVIGDVHGHCDELVALLRHLGYRERGRAWRHPARTALFVGDFIDRGPKQVESVDLVRRMVDAGSARAIMGNHELNAIAWSTEDPRQPGRMLRPDNRKTRAQHAAFLAAVGEGSSLHRELVEWFGTLPLWLDLPGLRLAHACSHPRFVDYLAERLTDGRLSAERVAAAVTKPEDPAELDTPELTLFKAVDAVAKGLEAPLPPGCSYVDKDGHRRERTRVRWWDPDAATLAEAALLAGAPEIELPDAPVPEHVRLGRPGERVHFVGHYWRCGEPRLLGPTVACVDYSVAKGGRLVAYRWEGEPVLDPARFAWVE